jgi:uncharacterized pyridoxal phosphate-containing UPF0001 family protein
LGIHIKPFNDSFFKDLICTTTASISQRHFGENYLQEALGKIAALENAKVCWHFIGPIQSNKTKRCTSEALLVLLTAIKVTT